MQNLLTLYRLPSGSDFDLSQVSPQDQGPFADSEEGKRFVEGAVEEIQHLQYKLFTENKQSLLIVLQAPDAAGKDGAIRHVLGKMNPQGCRAYSFKVPNDLESSHDFLWRIHAVAPATGMVSIFNRSHYEDVLVARVENLVPESIWRRRYDQINAFESLLIDRGTRILKFYLHISPEEQLKRFGQRLDDPEKHWKLNIGDYTARSKWAAYRSAYQEVFERCSPEAAPWFVIPADRKWHRNAAIAGILLETLRDMNPQLPSPTVDPEEVRKHYEAAKAAIDCPTEAVRTALPR
jgi:PPK2 family polyphosphate:nucleotide phosphotransferase